MERSVDSMPTKARGALVGVAILAFGASISPVGAQICDPQLFDVFDTPDDARSVCVRGRRAFVADGLSGLQTIDVSNPDDLGLVFAIDTPGFAEDVFVRAESDGMGGSQTVAYVADGSLGLQAIRVSAMPMMLGSLDTPGHATAVVVSGTNAYVADGTSGLQVIDVTFPGNPAPIGVGGLNPGGAIDLVSRGSIIYLVDDTVPGLLVIDVTIPALPLTVQTVLTPGSPRAVDHRGTIFYVADSTGIQIIDASTPATAFITDSIAVAGGADRVAIDGSRTYVTNTAGTLFVYDTTRIINPRLIGSTPIPGPALNQIGISTLGDQVYLANGTSGLQGVDAMSCRPFRITSVGLPAPASSVDLLILDSSVVVHGTESEFPDLVAAVPDLADPTGSPGDVVISFNQGDDADGIWLGYGDQISLEVGVNPSGVAGGALDDDLFADLIVSNFGDNSVTALINDGTGFTLGGELIDSFSVGSQPSGVALGNFDGAFGLDAGVANQNDGTVSILLNDGGLGDLWLGLSLNSTENVGSMSMPTSIALLNAQDDKWDDLVTSGFDDGSVSVLINNGFANFAPASALATGNGPSQVVTTDLDGDGDTDLMTSNQLGDSLTLRFNAFQETGMVDFTERIDVTVQFAPSSLAAIDVDLDGDLDIVVVADDGSGSKNLLRYVRNDSDRSSREFTLVTDPLPSDLDPQHIISGDVNTSSGIELVTTESASTLTVIDRVDVVCFGDGNGDYSVTFGDITSVLGNWLKTYAPGELGAGDANGDGTVNFADITMVLGSWLSTCP